MAWQDHNTAIDHASIFGEDPSAGHPVQGAFNPHPSGHPLPGGGGGIGSGVERPAKPAGAYTGVMASERPHGGPIAGAMQDDQEALGLHHTKLEHRNASYESAQATARGEDTPLSPSNSPGPVAPSVAPDYTKPRR
jgi:hypothetical protein